MGDTLPVLANRFGVELKYLARVNGLQPDSFLVMNTYLYVPPHSGYYHHVKSGETLSSIAARYRLDREYLAATNRIAPTASLRAGEVLIIPTRTRPAPVPDRPSPGSAYSPGQSRAGGTAVGGAHTPTQSRSSPAIRPSRSGANSYSSSSPARSGSAIAGMTRVETERLKVPRTTSRPSVPRQSEPGGSPSLRSSPSTTSRSAPAPVVSAPSSSRSRRRASDGRPTLQWPLEGTITRAYVNKSDQKHRGVDIAAPEGTAIRAAADGTVVYSGDDIPGYGRMVIVDHGRGWATCYAHNSRNLVKKDQRVGAGQVIAHVGDTGRATGPHCHFEVRHNYEAIDPMPLLP
jgi:murein DD-endopeptidase MepM/ murein hydrolase activator NlpD